MKKIFSFLLLTLICFSLLACSAEPSIQEDIQQEEPAVDMDGYEFLILQEYKVVDPFGYKETTIYADEMLARFDRLEQKYNCLINVSNDGGGDADLLKYVQANLSVGENIGEALYAVNSNMNAVFAYAGYLYPLTDVKEFLNYENSEKFGSAKLLEMSMLNSIPYTVYAVSLPEKVEAAIVFSIFVINENLIKNYNLTDPREFVEQGSWSFDKLTEILPTYHIKEGELEYKALGTTKDYFVKNAVLSNGVKYIQMVDDVISTDIYTDKAINAINYAKNVFDLYSDDLMIEPNYWTKQVLNAFKRGELVMGMICTPEIQSDIATAVDNFGIVPFPCGPDVEYGEWGADVMCAQGMSIFMNAESPEYAATLIDECLSPIEGEETLEDRVSAAMRKTYFDERDAKIMMTLLNKARYNYWTVGGNDFWTNAGNAISKSTGAEIVQKYGASIEKVVEKYISTNYDYMSAHE
ncbi:MAG: extracellular solute-binding protein family 1 [Clostridia bacterium]|nr:extracellular solute-binding protein family 1 [Clostridia bacterium]